MLPEYFAEILQVIYGALDARLHNSHLVASPRTITNYKVLQSRFVKGV